MGMDDLLYNPQHALTLLITSPICGARWTQAGVEKLIA